MNNIQRIIITFITFLISIFFISLPQVNAASFPGLETKIIAESSSVKIIKLQTFFQKLGLYTGEIDGEYNSVLPSLLTYQRNAGLIVNDNDWGAGYFGIQTLSAIKRDYPSEFDEYQYIIEQDKPEEGERYFYVTAYYSAIPGQDRYSYSSYLGRYRTYYEAIRMQGNGTNGASGKEVFPGMLAGPRNYNFGTKIQLDDIGIGAIEDRGGAIVNAGEREFEYDRIDVWMGFGDEGRLRAEKWGVRKVKGKIVSDDLDVSIAFNESAISTSFDLYITPESTSVDVKKLQSLFTELKLYDGSIDGRYLSIKEDIIDFQLKHEIISSKYSDQAGYFGKKTIAALVTEFNVEDSIFKENEAVIVEEDLTGLTRKEKFVLVQLRNKLVTYFEKRAKGNKLKITSQKTALQAKLDQVIKKSKNKNKINKLKYLKVIL